MYICMYVYHVNVWHPQRPEDSGGSPRTSVIHSLSHHVGVGN